MSQSPACERLRPSSPGPPHAMRDKNLRRPIAHRLRRGNGRCRGAAGAARMASRHPGEAASLARLQSAGEVYAFRRAKAVPGGGFPADLEARLQLRASADGLPLLDQGRQLGGVRRGDAQGDRPGGRVGREVRDSRLDQLSPRPRLYGRQPAGEEPASGPTPRRSASAPSTGPCSPAATEASPASV